MKNSKIIFDKITQIFEQGLISSKDFTNSICLLLISNLLLWQNSIKEFCKEFLNINYMLLNTALAHFTVSLLP